MNDMTNLPPRGHNGPPAFDPEAFAAVKTKVDDFALAAGEWADLGEIDSQDRAERASDFVAGARKVYKVVDEARKAAKAPHDEAAKAVQAAFAPLLKTVERAADTVKAMQTAWLKKMREAEEAARRAEQERIRLEREEAERLAAEAAARNDIAGQVAAEEALKEAEDAEKAAAKPVAARAGSATGAGRTMALRTTWRCEVEQRGPALAYYRDHPEVIALIERLASAEVRAQTGDKVAPQGFRLIKEEKAA